MGDDLRQRYAEALAAKFTRPIPRCDKWGENEWVENPEPADRVEQTVSVLYEASDGHLSIRFPTCMEVAEVVAAVRDEDLQAWRERAESAEAAIARVRRLCELTIAASCRVQAIDQARDTLAALDDAG